MRRDFIIAALIWVVLSGVGIVVVLQLNLFPIAAAREAAIIDGAFRLLLLLSVPVFAFVLVGLIYSILRFRRSGDEIEDGQPIHTHRTMTWTWFAVTSALAIFIILNPGIKGIRELSAGQGADLAVQVEAEQWQWSFAYPEYGISLEGADELVLPVDQRIRFEVTSTDVIHSFWIPAFRMKADAVPGQTDVIYVTPTRTGGFDDDVNLRVQCAELCGTGHARMRANVRVVTQAEFDAWVAKQSEMTQK